MKKEVLKILNNYKIILTYGMAAVVIGIIVGIIDTIFGRVLLSITDFRGEYVKYLVPFLPLAGLFIMLIYRKISRDSLKGMGLVFSTAHGDTDKIPILLVPLVIVSTWITHLFGGSAGREGVAVQLGATIAHWSGKKIPILNNKRALLVIGMSAGFAGLFQTPVAATFFALEVIVSGVLLYEILFPAIIGAFTASFTSHYLGLEKFSVKINISLDITMFMLLKLVVLGIAFGITGALFAHLLSILKNKASEIFTDPLKKIFIIGIFVAVMLLLVHMGRYAGLGTNLISIGFSGGDINSYDWILKLVFTVVTLSAGFQGGEVTPLFAIGTTLGIWLGGILGMPVMLTGALGYAAVFGSATNTLIAPIIIGAEVFGGNNILLFAVVCSVAFIFNGNRTIYSSQKRYSFFDSEEL